MPVSDDDYAAMRAEQARSATGPQYPASGPPPQVNTSGMAVASLVLGILWMWGLGALLAVIFGYKGRNEIDRSNGWITGRGMATAGIVLGWIGIAGAVLVTVVFVIALSATNRAIEELEADWESSRTGQIDDNDAPLSENEIVNGVDDALPGLGDTLRVCTDTPFEPFAFEDPDTGELTGFDMELVGEIASRLGMEMNVVVREFEGIWLAPAAGECDIVASAVTITEERAQGAPFSDPYFSAANSLLVLRENADAFTTLDDLAGGTIGVLSATTGEDYAEGNLPEGAELRRFDDSDSAFLALEAGEVDAVLQDLAINGFRAAQSGGVLVVVETFVMGEEYGFVAAPEEHELIDAINATLVELRADGTYEEIHAEWFGEVGP
jgi:polar amino acid transport system substrate-binding protein